MTDAHTYLLFQDSLAGGIVQVLQRYAKKRKNSMIMYLDVNGLYGHLLLNAKLPYKLSFHDEHPAHLTHEQFNKMVLDDSK